MKKVHKGYTMPSALKSQINESSSSSSEEEHHHCKTQALTQKGKENKVCGN